MPRGPRVDNEVLVSKGLELMERLGKPLAKLASAGRSMLYSLANGETVRIRTCNDHLLIVLSDKASGEDARLNIEGTDWLLVVMPEIPRTPGDVIAYLVPTNVAVLACRQSHAKWLATNPNTKGNNTTWNMWFEDGPGPSDGFAGKWREYLLNETDAASLGATFSGKPSAKVDIKAEVEDARQRISKLAGVPLDGVKITIQFGL